MRLHRFDVELYEPSSDDWWIHDPSGSILLPEFASEEDVEHALAVVEVYAPRGADRLEWLEGNVPAAIIYDATGTPMVRLWLH